MSSIPFHMMGVNSHYAGADLRCSGGGGSLPYQSLWILLSAEFCCGGPQRGSGASCPFLNWLFEHPVQILPGPAGDNCPNSRRQRLLLFRNHAVVESAGRGVWYYLAMCLYPSNMPEKDLGDHILSMKPQYVPGFVCSRSKPGTL